MTKGLRTWINIERKALEDNYKAIRTICHGKKLMAVVKSNAYAHGLIGSGKEFEKLGADFIAVDSIVEALALREDGVKIPILVLGYTLPERIEEAVERNISLTVSSFETLNNLIENDYGSKIKVHIKADTGFHRQGFLENQMEEVLDLILKNKDKLEIEGLYTHFAQAKNPEDRKYTEEQIKVFEKWIKAFKDKGLEPMSHASATAGLMLYPEANFDCVRSAAGLYGIWPSQETKKYLKDNVNLKPALSWQTLISEIKELPKGAQIGYDLSETLEKDSKIAICPIGYWHGFPRSMSSQGEVLVSGKKAKVLGRVSMDMITIDVSNCDDVKVGSVVTIIGNDGDEEITAYEIAEKADTTAYEILTRINPLIKRIYF